MFATFSFAQVAFAVQQLLGIPTPPSEVKVGGNASKKKKYKTYTIFGKQYRLTAEEYRLYQIQRKQYEEKVKTVNEVVKEEPTISYTVDDLIQMYGKPTVHLETFDIPLIQYFTDDSLIEYARKQLDILNAKRKKQIEQDDEDLIQLISMGYIL